MAGTVWLCYDRQGRRIGRAKTRRAAMNRLHKPYYWRGRVCVVHSATGECWERRGGAWFQVASVSQSELVL